LYFEVKKADRTGTRIYDYEAIKNFIDTNPDCTQSEIVREFKCSKGLVWKVLRFYKYTRKKKRFSYQEQDPVKPTEYRNKLERVPIHKRYFLDECGINKTPIREYGYSQKGQEIQDKRSAKRHSNTTIVSLCNKQSETDKYKNTN
jgi:hypothetical protein